MGGLNNQLQQIAEQLEKIADEMNEISKQMKDDLFVIKTKLRKERGEIDGS